MTRKYEKQQQQLSAAHTTGILVVIYSQTPCKSDKNTHKYTKI